MGETAGQRAVPNVGGEDLADRPATRLATRLAFLVAGFGIACWAPLVPYAKQRLGADDGVIGLVLLCLGVGSLGAMVLSGLVSARHGSKPVILAGGLGMVVLLPWLALASTPASLGAALFVFGAALGALDVAMNVHAVEVERAAPRPLMSGFHALFSIGGFLGASLVTLLLSLGLSPLASTLPAAALMLVAMLMAWPRLLRAKVAGDGPGFVLPHGRVLVLALLAAVMFLAEGAVLDWSALLITSSDLADEARGGLGFMVFSIAMTLGRLTGDAVTARFGDRATFFWGGCVALAGFVMLLLSPHLGVALAGFMLIGLGAANLVPILFRRAGSQTQMPASLAIGAVTTLGYAGILIGPAAIGFVANAASLPTAFWLLTGLVGLVPPCALALPAFTTRPHAPGSGVARDE